MIIKRGEKYNVRIWIPDATVKARRRLHWVGSYETRKEARMEEAKAIVKVKSRPRGTRAWTIEQFYARWVARYHGPGTRRGDTTLTHNQDAIKTFLAAHGKRRLDSFEVDEARDFAGEFAWRAKVVAAFFEDAVRDGKLHESPFKHVARPKAKGRQHIDPLTMDEVERLAMIASDVLGFYGAHFASFIRVAAWTGMRPGELVRLEWRDIKWDTAEIDVRRTKTESDRLVPLGARARDELERIVRCGDGVFYTARQVPLRSNSYRWYWAQVRSVFEAEVPADHWLASRLRRKPDDHLAVYELRHTFGSYLAHLGLSAWDISLAMGNSAKVCESVYVHPHKSAVRDRIRMALDAPVGSLSERTDLRDAR